MRTRILTGAAVALSIWLAGCGGVRESRPLQYPGNSMSAAEALGTVISKRGFAPSCKPREFCKFKYAEPVTLHFKIKPGRVTLAVDVKGGDDMEPAELQKLIGQMMALGEDIWNEARPMALAQEEELRRAEEVRRAEAERQAAIARAEWERRAAEQARIDAERQAAEQARLEAERQAAARVLYPELTYVKTDKGAAFHFVLPEESVCRVEGDSAWSAPQQLEIPFQIKARPDLYYTFDCQLPLGVTWHQKLQAKAGFVATVRLYQGAPPPPDPLIGPPVPPGPAGPPHPHHHPPPATEPVVAGAMSPTAFASLTASVEKESFSADKMRPIQIAAGSSRFTAKQVAALVDLMTFSADKIKVVELTRARIVDKGNGHVILDRFTFSSDKEKVTRLLTE